MKVSVAIAAYRGEKFIGELISSLFAQTMAPDEIVITDDSPDDLTENAVKAFDDPRIIYHRNERQLKVNRNFEKAISLCRGEYIFLCDQDDIWLPDKIKTMVKSLDNAPDAAGIFCNSKVVNTDLKPLGFSLWQMRKFTPALQQKFKNGKQLAVFFKRITCSTHNIALRRSAVAKTLPLPELDPFYIDTFFGLNFAIANQWLICDRELTLYRVHTDNLSAPQNGNLLAQAALSVNARKQNSLLRTAEIATELITRFNTSVDNKTLTALKNYRLHHQNRAAYSKNIFCRFFQISRELFAGRYRKYSALYKAVVDLLIGG